MKSFRIQLLTPRSLPYWLNGLLFAIRPSAKSTRRNGNTNTVNTLKTEESAKTKQGKKEGGNETRKQKTKRKTSTFSMSDLPPHPSLSHPPTGSSVNTILRGPPPLPSSSRPPVAFARPSLPTGSSSSVPSPSCSLMHSGGGAREGAVPANAFTSLRAQQTATRGGGGSNVEQTSTSGNGGMATQMPSVARSVTLETKRGRFKALQFGSHSNATDCSPVVFFIHGAGMTSMGFALCATALNKMSLSNDASGMGTSGAREVRSLAFDLRCHGESTCEGGEGSLTMECLVDDAIVVIQEAIATWYPAVRAVYIVGHSLGGAIVANLMAEKPDVIGFKVAAVAVLDVVEGTAKQSLQHMQGFLDRRPKSFSSKEAAVKWFLGAGGLKGEQSASLSVPTLVKKVGGGEEKEGAGDNINASASAASTTPSGPNKQYVWRTDLTKTLPLWGGWFEDLDRKFLAIPCPKMLLLAVTDRLDKELTIGHMMGRFQLEVVGASSNCGHYVMEDCPDIVAGKLLRMIRRIDTLYARLPVLNHQKVTSSPTTQTTSAAVHSFSGEANV